MRFPELFEAGKIGTMRVPNRILMAPMETNQSSNDGLVTAGMIDYYAARAAGGAGLIIVEATCVELSRGRLAQGQLGIDDDRCVEGLSKLAASVQEHGARIALQLHHAGRNGHRVQDLIAPSAVELYPGSRTPREMTRTQIEEMVEKFAVAAWRTKLAGCDGIELHGAHQYLISQFLSRSTNKREDDYGGSLANRARFLLEIIAACRREVGSEFPLWVRLSAREYGLENGITMEESLQVSQWAEGAGADAVSVSCYGVGSDATINMPYAPGAIAWMAAKVKDVLRVPVMAVGRLGPAPAARLLREGKADFIAVGRAMLADPNWAAKVREDRVDEIRPCISCWECMTFGGGANPIPIRCTVNPSLAREREFVASPAARSRTVLVVGGGPAGLEAARTAAERGHRVTLCEKEEQLGGQLLVAGVAPQQTHINALRSYLVREAKRAGVKVVQGKELTSREIVDAQPDAVVLATGCTPKPLELPGIENRPVTSAVDVLAGTASVGQRVVVVGGERVGCQAAEVLAKQGKQVTLMRRQARLATKMNMFGSRFQRDRLAAAGVRLLTGVRYLRVADEGLVVLTKEGTTETVACDTIVSAIGAERNDTLFQSLRGRIEVHPVGDMLGPKTVWEAVSEGRRAGMSV